MPGETLQPQEHGPSPSCWKGNGRSTGGKGCVWAHLGMPSGTESVTGWVSAEGLNGVKRGHKGGDVT